MTSKLLHDLNVRGVHVRTRLSDWRPADVLPPEMELREPRIPPTDHAASHYIAWLLHPEDEYRRMRFLCGAVRRRAEAAGIPPRDQDADIRRHAPGGPQRLDKYIDRGRRHFRNYRVPLIYIALRMLERREADDPRERGELPPDPDDPHDLAGRYARGELSARGARSVDDALRLFWELSPGELPYDGSERNARADIVRPAAPVLPMLLALFFDFRTIQHLHDRVAQGREIGQVAIDGPLARYGFDGYEAWRALLDDASWVPGALSTAGWSANLIPYVIPRLIPASGPLYLPR